MTGGTVQSVECVPQNADSFKGKIYQWVNGDNIGLCDVVDRTVLIGGKPHLIFESGFECSLLETEKNMIMVDFAGSYVANLQLKYDSRTNIEQPTMAIEPQHNQIQQTQIVANPIKILIDKAKREQLILNLSLVVDFIPYQLYNVILQSFETNANEVFELVMNDENKTIIMNQIAEHIKEQFKI